MKMMDLMFEDMNLDDLNSVCLTCRHFYTSANKHIYRKVAITAAVEGDMRRFSNFLKTILIDDTLDTHVKHLDIKFSDIEMENHSFGSHGRRKVDAHEILSPNKDLFQNSMNNLEVGLPSTSMKSHATQSSITHSLHLLFLEPETWPH